MGHTGCPVRDVIDDSIRDSKEFTQLHPTLPITIRRFHVLHGCTSKGDYESSAYFFRYDPSTLQNTRSPADPSLPWMTPAIREGSDEGGVAGEQQLREFLFFGDIESDWRREEDKSHDIPSQHRARELNGHIWQEAADSFGAGRLAGIFVSRLLPWM